MAIRRFVVDPLPAMAHHNASPFLHWDPAEDTLLAQQLLRRVSHKVLNPRSDIGDTAGQEEIVPSCQGAEGKSRYSIHQDSRAKWKKAKILFFASHQKLYADIGLLSTTDLYNLPRWGVYLCPDQAVGFAHYQGG